MSNARNFFLNRLESLSIVSHLNVRDLQVYKKKRKESLIHKILRTIEIHHKKKWTSDLKYTLYVFIYSFFCYKLIITLSIEWI